MLGGYPEFETLDKSRFKVITKEVRKAKGRPGRKCFGGEKRGEWEKSTFSGISQEPNATHEAEKESPLLVYLAAQEVNPSGCPASKLFPH